jgi:hypothetical protein
MRDGKRAAIEPGMIRQALDERGDARLERVAGAVELRDGALQPVADLDLAALEART